MSKYENPLDTYRMKKTLDKARAALRSSAQAKMRYLTAEEAAALGYPISPNYSCEPSTEDYQGAFPSSEGAKRGRSRPKKRSIFYQEPGAEEDLPTYPTEAIG